MQGATELAEVCVDCVRQPRNPSARHPTCVPMPAAGGFKSAPSLPWAHPYFPWLLECGPDRALLPTSRDEAPRSPRR
eukprot:CAMPEP_0206310702 /NCGR_PEP_ID=MMETSP0106_2-20121207/13063_1 /ASSEMBLY_ACC=CAM_ASM_000206 /TAXON_ID=81532 /ORGANISM="Acanthoeca-like sp., Strain 10tr" /LENGTH=76 /DNA_ID=CAMNT_0053741885 /DNA_START=1 /DNA_END=227 /DNA_ORIENTATION=+